MRVSVLKAFPSRSIVIATNRLVSMSKTFCIIIVSLIAALSQSSCFLRSFSEGVSDTAAPAQGYQSLEKFPFKEAWYGMYFQEDKVGYSHFKIDPSGENFVVSNESYMRLTAMKKTNEIDMKEKVKVRPDLSMISFESDVVMNGKKLHMTGQTKADKFVVEIAVDGEKLDREFPLEQKLYHSSAISLMPALRGLTDGAAYTFSVFNAEKQGLDRIEQTISAVAGTPGPQGAVWKAKNAYGRTVVFSWLNKKGQTVIEKALNGSLVTVLEDEAAARKFAEKKTLGKDLVLDFSLIKVEKPILNPEKARFLKVKMQGIEKSAIPEDGRQTVTAEANSPTHDFYVTIKTENVGVPGQPGAFQHTESSLTEFLASTVSVQSNHQEIIQQAERIVKPNDSRRDKIEKLLHWTAENIARKMQDSFTSLAVLRSKEGECQSHANLYTALARSQKIPSRVVTGLVYSDKVGFLYHAWVESYDNGWIAVDPTSDQIPADATHIKVYTGESPDNTQLLFQIMGKLKIDVVEFR